MMSLVFRLFRWAGLVMILLGMYQWVMFCTNPRPLLSQFFRAFPALVFGGMTFVIGLWESFDTKVRNLKREIGSLRRVDRMIFDTMERDLRSATLTRNVATMEPRVGEVNLFDYVVGVDRSVGCDLCSIVILRDVGRRWEVVGVAPVSAEEVVVTENDGQID